MAMAVTQVTDSNSAMKLIRIKNIPHSLLFSLLKLGKVRRSDVTDIMLATTREYAFGLRVVDENGRMFGQEHTLLKVLDKFYLHLFHTHSLNT